MEEEAASSGKDQMSCNDNIDWSFKEMTQKYGQTNQSRDLDWL